MSRFRVCNFLSASPPSWRLAAPCTGMAAEKLKVAVLVPGLANDGSFNQVALEGAKKLADEGLITFEIREKQRDPASSEPVIRQYAQRDYDLIIGHGIELSEPILNVAKDFPKVHFAASGGPDLAGKLIANTDGWTYDFAQQGYLSGWVAGKLGVSKVGARRRSATAVHPRGTQRLQGRPAETDPSATVVEVFTGSFDDVQKAAEATKGLIAQGAAIGLDLGRRHRQRCRRCRRAGQLHTLGVTGSAGGLAQKVNIVSVELDMYPTFKSYVDAVKDGSFGKKFFVSGLANHGLILTPVNEVDKRVPSDLQKQVEALVGQLASGAKTLPDFYGPAN